MYSYAGLHLVESLVIAGRVHAVGEEYVYQAVSRVGPCVCAGEAGVSECFGRARGRRPCLYYCPVLVFRTGFFKTYCAVIVMLEIVLLVECVESFFREEADAP